MIDSETEDDIHFVVVDIDKTEVIASTDGAEGNDFGGFDKTGDVVYEAGFEVKKLIAVPDSVDAAIGIGEQLWSVDREVLGRIVRWYIGRWRQCIEIGLLVGAEAFDPVQLIDNILVVGPGAGGDFYRIAHGCNIHDGPGSVRPEVYGNNALSGCLQLDGIGVQVGIVPVTEDQAAAGFEVFWWAGGRMDSDIGCRRRCYGASQQEVTYDSEQEYDNDK